MIISLENVRSRFNSGVGLTSQAFKDRCEVPRLISVMGITVRRGKVVAIDVLADPARLRRLDLAVLND
jgi:hypothetical protein